MELLASQAIPGLRPIRSAVAGSPRLIVDSLRGLLVSGGAEVIGDGEGDYQSLRILVEQQQPDVVLVCPPLKELDDLTQILELRRFHPDLAFVIMVRETDTRRVLWRLAQSSGVALVDTQARAADLKVLLQAALAWSVAICPLLVKRVFPNEDLPRQGPPVAMSRLGPRECRVLQYLSEGKGETEVAESMKMSVRSIQSCVARAREKLNAKDRAHAIALAITGGLIEGPSWEARKDR